MSDDYKPVLSSEMTLEYYPCGVKAGDIVYPRNKIELRNARNRKTGKAWKVDSPHLILFGHPAEPDVIWMKHLEDGYEHTWDETILDYFEKG